MLTFLIFSVCFRFDYQDEVFKANIDALDQSVRNQSLLGMIQFMPFLEFLPKIMPKDAMLLKNVKMRDDYALEQLQKHKDTFDADNPRDFIDAYLARMSKCKSKGEHTSFDGNYIFFINLQL